MKYNETKQNLSSKYTTNISYKIVGQQIKIQRFISFVFFYLFKEGFNLEYIW